MNGEITVEQVCVTGASGKLGQAVVRDLLAHGYTVVAIDRSAPADPLPDGVRSITVDLLDIGHVSGAMHGCDAVIHLGAIPAPYGHPDEVVMRNNTGATFAVLQAASLLGIRRVAIASSGAIYGTAWSPAPLAFRYAPVDEAHPIMVRDVYALSKEIDDRTAAMFARRDGMSIAALRFHWIATRAEQLARAVASREEADQTHEAGNLWGYVDLDDASRACRLAIEAARDQPFGFVPLQIVAADTYSETPTMDLLRRWAPQTRIRAHIPGTASAYDCSAARRVIGWEARRSWRDP